MYRFYSLTTRSLHIEQPQLLPLTLLKHLSSVSLQFLLNYRLRLIEAQTLLCQLTVTLLRITFGWTLFRKGNHGGFSCSSAVENKRGLAQSAYDAGSVLY